MKSSIEMRSPGKVLGARVLGAGVLVPGAPVKVLGATVLGAAVLGAGVLVLVPGAAPAVFVRGAPAGGAVSGRAPGDGESGGTGTSVTIVSLRGQSGPACASTRSPSARQRPSRSRCSGPPAAPTRRRISRLEVGMIGSRSTAASR